MVLWFKIKWTLHLLCLPKNILGLNSRLSDMDSNSRFQSCRRNQISVTEIATIVVPEKKKRLLPLILKFIWSYAVNKCPILCVIMGDHIQNLLHMQIKIKIKPLAYHITIFGPFFFFWRATTLSNFYWKRHIIRKLNSHIYKAYAGFFVN